MAWTIFSAAVAVALMFESYRRLCAVRVLSGRVSAELAAPPPGSALPPSAARARVAALNEASVEIRSGLALTGVVPRGCAKAALSTGALAAIMQAASMVEGEGTALTAAPTLSFASGCVGAVGCMLLGRAAEQRARQLRADWATLMRRSSGDVPS